MVFDSGRIELLVYRFNKFMVEIHNKTSIERKQSIGRKQNGDQYNAKHV